MSQVGFAAILVIMVYSRSMYVHARMIIVGFRVAKEGNVWRTGVFLALIGIGDSAVLIIPTNGQVNALFDNPSAKPIASVPFLFVVQWLLDSLVRNNYVNQVSSAARKRPSASRCL